MTRRSRMKGRIGSHCPCRTTMEEGPKTISSSSSTNNNNITKAGSKLEGDLKRITHGAALLPG